jgi:glucarate dehydratase
MDDLRIASVRHWMLRIPFHADMEWASGRRTGVTRLVVRLETAGGVVGWGETICLLDAVPAVLEKVVMPVALTKRVDQAEALHRHVLGAGYYHHKRAAVMAICAVEMAMWDALGRATGRPLHALWGGLYRDRAEMAAYILAADPGAAAEAAREYLRRGHRSFKVKIGMSEATDIALVRAVRQTVGEGVPVRADVNGAWTPGTARRQLDKLRGFDLQYIEQPLELDDLAGHAALRRTQPVPVALDESAYTLQEVGNILRMEAADVLLLDPHEAGGLWPVVKQAGACEAVGVPVLLHSGGELGLSQAAYLHLAASIPNMTISLDTEYAHLSADIVAERFVLDDGCFAVPAGPGLGVTVEEEALERFRVECIEGAYLDERRPGWFPVKPAY